MKLAEEILSMDEEITQIKEELKNRQSKCRKALNEQFEQMMKPYKTTAMCRTELLKKERLLRFSQLVNKLKNMSKNDFKELFWNNNNEVVSEAIKKSKRIAGYKMIELACERCGEKSRMRVCNPMEHNRTISERWFCDNCEEYYETLTADMDYREYLKSEHWVNFATETKAQRNKCEECSSDTQLHVHHLHYDTLFRESQEDVSVLCKKCHAKLH